MPENHVEEVAAASAAYLYNALPSLVRLPPPELYRRLESYFVACLIAYRDTRTGWAIPDPSDN